MIQGSALIVGTDHEDFIQGSADFIVINDQISGKDMRHTIFSYIGIDSVFGGAGVIKFRVDKEMIRFLERAVMTTCLDVLTTITLL
ncbi:MAG TPA: hypothetical protein VKA91_02250 [Nitrososphaeraceae archaeon]|nr:hypothetical protein [Nitrososphaeraceae archaeon]